MPFDGAAPRLPATGPVHIYCGVEGTGPGGSPRGPAYFGTGETAPEIKPVALEYEPVFNDLGGSRLGFDDMFEGYEYLINVTMTRWNDKIFQRLEALPTQGFEDIGGLHVDIGSMSQYAHGALMLQQGLALPLWLQFPFASAIAANVQHGMLPGYHFIATYLIDHSRPRMGTRPNALSLAFKAKRVWLGYGPAAGPNLGGFVCFDDDMSALATVSPE